MNFEFASSQRIIFGSGNISQAKELIKSFGSRIMIVTGKHNSMGNIVLDEIQRFGQIKTIHIICDKEPDIVFIGTCLKENRKSKPDVVVAMGGGSVIDAGKALAILLSNEGDVRDYLEVVGKGKHFACQSLPFIAIPTTSGTGSEATRNAVITDRDNNVKASLRSPFMLPKVALIDPELILGLPHAITASTGMDALTQVIEPFITRKANPLTDAICIQALSIARHALETSYCEPNNLRAREQMSLVSLLGGMALANSGLGVVHGFAAAIGGMFPEARHGQICAALLPASFQVNYDACRRKDDLIEITRKMDKISILLSGNDQTPGGISLNEIAQTLNIPRLAHLGMTKQDFPLIIQLAMQSSSMKGNPVNLESDELQQILEMSY